MAIATQKVIDCQCGGNARICQDAEQMAEAAAQQRWTQAENQQVYSLRGLEELVRRLSILPGQRGIVFVSRGFLSESQMQRISEIIDRAVRAGVVVNGFDARGLYAYVPGGDASQPGPSVPTAMAGQLVLMDTTAMRMDADVMAEMADGTGGVFFQNSNDFDAGFRAAGALAEFSYVLVFSPSELKPNGKFHQLKVTLTAEAKAPGVTLQARRGYFAPGANQNIAARQKEEIADAVYSRDELNSSRVRIGSRFFKSSSTEARVTIVAHLDAQGLSFRIENDRHVDDLVFITVLFDINGNFVQGLEKTLAMHLRDATLENIHAAGISMASDFKVPPGTYLVREVVHDSAGVISTRNDTVEIPY